MAVTCAVVVIFWQLMRFWGPRNPNFFAESRLCKEVCHCDADLIWVMRSAANAVILLLGEANAFTAHTRLQTRPVGLHTRHAASNLCRSPPASLAFWSPPPPPPPPPFGGVQVIRRDAAAYLGLLALGLVPAIDFSSVGGASIPRLAYFLTLAIGTVYLGSKRQDKEGEEVAPVGLSNAALAPVFASISLGGLYLLIKYTGLDAGAIFRSAACLLAFFSLAELGEDYFQLALLPPGSTPEESPERAEAASAAALAVALAIVYAYLQGPQSSGGALPLRAFAAVNNYLAWPIVLSALGILFLESYQAGALLLSGLFCYDAFFVFKSDVMITVATQLEAPAKLLFSSVELDQLVEGKYPFSVLGLGDLAIPGAFVALLRQFDAAQAGPKAASARDEAGNPTYESPYFTAGMVGYAVGLLSTFAANTLTKSGQPALVYIVPSLLIASAGTAAQRGELDELLSFKSPRAAKAREAREQYLEERRKKKEDAKLAAKK